ncbi:hypothetical protein I3J09_23510 [Streptomyces clavuligerus]|uniref:hypothetical protein n=1 Tax=Streptomyces clavuligerus TaxID=1901 RepID=UPI00020D94A8|nr:hypothetical protein [Streptomyces clavuligerus]MBY6305635.1 hypothetical protein [Streptomyces clavuligerus]QPJ92358.1 hypothetical protein GE265_04635 [Streptomyces clavuligerus]QPL65527.1 hypothetical protein I3J04_23495 [Streptomyces clavuligerus]QPL71557.1 hypothetical protein I3J05_23505 [Streptomyces clavuligerus]QPL72369.1 hypothetical protein I3J05_28060 [Streptomyces clavuligerus]
MAVPTGTSPDLSAPLVLPGSAPAGVPDRSRDRACPRPRSYDCPRHRAATAKPRQPW